MTSRSLPLAGQSPPPAPGALSLDALRASVRDRYGAVAGRVGDASAAACAPAGASSGCCGDAGETWDPITADLYEQGETAGLPAGALLASLGCGNPTALAELAPGEIVLDLGAGGGIAVLLSARRVGSTGKAYGLDMTDEMLALARANQAAAGATNVEFLKGHIEAIPLPDASVDVVISNCVINLSGDKPRVLAEAFRVLRPGGRFAVSDVILRDGLPEDVRRSMPMWTGCVAGALEESEFLALLSAVGFDAPSIEPTREYTRDDALALIAGTGLDPALADRMAGTIMSGFVRARKPAADAPTVRAARSSDLPAIEALLAANDLPVHGVADALASALVAEHRGRVVGAAALEPCGDAALVRSVVVDAAWRGRGVGERLVTRLLTRADANGLAATYLLTTTAGTWFPRFGFAPIARDAAPPGVRGTAEFRELCPDSAVVMHRARGGAA
ncbi:MAG: arsenic resistance N-acetyltransferase ArsN2 [Gemmatimonadota bacterium]